MIVLLDTSEDLKVCEAEIGCPVEQLLTPLTRFTAQYPEERFAIDNGAYKRFSATDWVKSSTNWNDPEQRGTVL